MQKNVLEDFLAEIECSVCNNYMLNEIAQCIQGHSFCITCRGQLKQCPLCHASFSAGRNYTLENLIGTWEFSCQNQKKGCSFQGPAIRTMSHEKNECEYHNFFCPIKDATNCSWAGKIVDMRNHMLQIHNGISTFHSESLNIEFVEYYNCLFKVLHRRSDANLEWCVKYVGSRKNAENYMFRFEFIDQSKSGFEAVFTGLCEQYGDDKDAFNFEKISIHEDTLKRFKNKTQSYSYKITIIQK